MPGVLEQTLGQGRAGQALAMLLLCPLIHALLCLLSCLLNCLLVCSCLCLLGHVRVSMHARVGTHHPRPLTHQAERGHASRSQLDCCRAACWFRPRCFCGQQAVNPQQQRQQGSSIEQGKARHGRGAGLCAGALLAGQHMAARPSICSSVRSVCVFRHMPALPLAYQPPQQAPTHCAIGTLATPALTA